MEKEIGFVRSCTDTGDALLNGFCAKSATIYSELTDFTDLRRFYTLRGFRQRKEVCLDHSKIR